MESAGLDRKTEPDLPTDRSFAPAIGSMMTKSMISKSMAAACPSNGFALLRWPVRRASARPTPAGLLRRRFLLDEHFDVGGYILVQLDGDGELAERLQRLVQLDLAAIDVEAFFFECVGDVAGGHRAE
jgi:hypothetical protein